MELGLDRSEIRKNVRMIELQIVQDRRARQVVDELRALVEECGVVFIRLDDEKKRIP